MNIYFFGAYTHGQISRRNFAKNLFRSVSGTGLGRFQKSDPDPVKNYSDPQHCLNFLIV
jgi:hypothetical protein